MRSFWSLLLLALLPFTGPACGRAHRDPGAPGGRRLVVAHAAGTTTLTGTPERVVAMGPLTVESLLAIGVRPVAITLFSNPSASQQRMEYPPYLLEHVRDLPTVGGRTDPNIEAIIGHRPDLILGTDEQTAGYDAFGHAAPTVLLRQAADWRTPREQEPWRVALQECGRIFGREPHARRRVTEYDQAAAEAGAAIRSAIGGQTVLLVRTLAKGMRVHGRSHGTVGHVLYRDLGLRPPPGMPDTYASQYVPMEQLVAYDPDHIFLIRGNPQLTDQLLRGPIWSRLKAVRAGNVYDVHLYWIRGHGWYGKMAIVADARRHLAARR